MALAQRIWAYKASLELKTKLGNYCARCKRKRKDLQFDCIIPMGDSHHKYEWSWRVSFYRKMFRENNLQLLCGYCHPIKTREDLNNYPF